MSAPFAAAEVAITFFPDFAAATKREASLTLHDLAQLITATSAPVKKALPWLKLGRFGDTKTDNGSLRSNENLQACTGIEADYDGERVAFGDAVSILKEAGVSAIIYTSPSHAEAKPRWRVLCQFSEERSPEQRDLYMARLNGLFNGIFARESWTLSQSYYYGFVNGNPSHRAELIEGTPIDLLAELDAMAIGRPKKPGANGHANERPTGSGGDSYAGTSDARLEGFRMAVLDTLRHSAIEGQKHHALRSAALALGGIQAAAGFGDAQAIQWLLDALPETVADWRAAQATAAWGLREGRLKPLDLEDRPRPGNGSTAPPDSGGEAPTPDLKRPLFRPLPAAPAFPMEALGELRRPAEAIQVRTQAPAAICAQSVLAATSLAAQAHRDVELPGCGRRPLTGLYGSVAESGERKTTVDRQALAPAYRVEEQWRGEREGQISGFVNDMEAWKAAREAAKKKHKGDRVAIKAALDAIGAEPKPPPQAMLLVEDFSPEALVLHLRDSRPWAGVFTSEGGVLVGGHAFNAEKAMATAALLNCLWDGSPIRRVRVLTGNAFLPGRRCSSHIMMQPVVAARLLGDAMLDGIGLMARLLVVDPESTMGHRPFREATAECAEILREYMARMTTLLTRPPATAPDAPDVLDPPAMKLTGAARDLWVRFHDAVERDLRSDGALHPIRAFGAKMAEHAGRLAAVLTVYADPDAMDVDEAAMACGIRLAQHYAAEMLRLQGSASVSPDLRLADRLLAWWQKRPDPQCYLAQIYQRGLNAIGDAATVRRIVTILVEHGWLRPLKPGIVIDGVHRREAWTLVP